MAAKEKAAKAGNLARAAGGNVYLQRMLEDENLRDNIRNAYESSRDAYDRLSNGKGPAKAILEDRKLHRDLNEAASALREAGLAMTKGGKRRKGFGLGKKLVVVVVGAGAALALSEGLRTKVLDLLFGAEEEFEYSSTTTPASAPNTVST